MKSGAQLGLSKRQLEFIAFGGSIGAGLFLGVGQGIRLAGPGMLLAYATAGLMVFIVARGLGEMALADGKPDVFLRYTERYIGPMAAFVQGWSYWICCVLICMAELTAAALFMAQWFPNLPGWITEFTGLALVFAINRSSVRVFGEVEFWISLVKIVTIVGFLILGLFLLSGLGGAKIPGASVSNLWEHGGWLPKGVGGVLTALPLALFAFGGSELIGIAAAEAETPTRAVPKAINGVLIRLGVFYLGTTAVLLCLEPWNSVPTDSSPIVQVLARIGVPAAANLMNVVLISAVLSSCNSILYAATRTLKVLGAIGGAPGGLAKVNVHGAPEVAGRLIVVVIALGLISTRFLPHGVFGLLLTTVAIIALVNWALFLIANLRFRGRPEAQSRRFATPGAPWSIYLVLLLIAVTIVIAAFDRDLRLAVVFAAVAMAILTMAARIWSEMRYRRTAIAAAPR
ncbi:MAG: amino acid permease [Caulobacteraceae bacterium]